MTRSHHTRREPAPSAGDVRTPRDRLRIDPTQSVTTALADSSGDHYYCGYGKVAMRAILDALDAAPGDNVVLPAAVPHAFVEPLRARGVEPRYHRVTETLGADLDDVGSCLDDRTVAVVLVHYFGFANPDRDAIRAAAADAGVPVVEDNSHAALSAPGGRLLGTESAFGFTSLHKTLHVPNGAVVYTDGSTRLSDPFLGVAERPSLADVRFLTGTVASRTPGIGALARRLNDGPTDGTSSESPPPVPTPYESMRRYEATKQPLSWLTARILDHTSVASVVTPRRESYERWAMALDAPPLYDLEPGVCPWTFPVVVDDAHALARRVPGAFAWPRLPRDVRSDEYPVATDLSRTLLALPVGQPERVASLASVVE